MNIKNYFSLDAIKQKSAQLTTRFPISVLFVVIFAVLLVDLFSNEGSYDASSLPYRLYLFFSVGAIVAAAAVLWLEDRVAKKKQYIITAAITLLWGAYCFFLPSAYKLESLPQEFILNKSLEIATIAVIATLAIFFIAFLKRNNDNAFWNFSARSLNQFILACCFAAILNVGLSGAVLAVTALFGVDTGHKIYMYIAIFCNALFAPLYFLANIPSGANKHDDIVAQNKNSKIFGLYILTPLALVYAVILYVYLFQIIFTWQLPRGLVSWLVSALALVGMLIITILYPTRKNENSKFVALLSRWLGVMILPLLILMTVGIARRVSDYGITIFRGYLIWINVWFYAIYAHIFITKATRIKWILISFCALMILSSIGFWSVPNVTKHIMTAEVKTFLDNQKISFEIERGKLILDERFENMELSDRVKIIDRIIYLRDMYGYPTIERFFDDGTTVRGIDDFLRRLRSSNALNTNDERLSSRPDRKIGGDADSSEWKNFTIGNDLNNRVFDIDKAKNAVAHLRYIGRDEKDITYSFESNNLVVTIVPDDRSFTIPLRAIAENNNDGVIIGNDYEFYLTSTRGRRHEATDSVALTNLWGILFYER